MSQAEKREMQGLRHLRQALMCLWELDLDEFRHQLEQAARLVPELIRPLVIPDQDLQSYLLEAVAGLEQQLRAWPDRPERAENLLLMQLLLKLWQSGPQTHLDALALIRDYLETQATFPGLEVFEIQACYHGYKTQEGLELADKALAGRPESPHLLYLKSLLLIQAKRPDEAESLLKTALSRFPEEALLLGSLGTLYLDQGRTSDALALLKQARELNPLRPEITAALHAGLRLKLGWYQTWHRFRKRIPAWMGLIWQFLAWPLESASAHLADLYLAADPNARTWLASDLAIQARRRLIIVAGLGLLYYSLLGLALQRLLG